MFHAPKTPKRPDHVLIEVRDRKNPDRLLGYLTKKPLPTLKEGHTHFNVTVHEGGFLSAGDIIAMGRHGLVGKRSYITFDLHYRPNHDGYEMKAEFRTDSPLVELQLIPDFLVLGETWHCREIRRRGF